MDKETRIKVLKTLERNSRISIDDLALQFNLNESEMEQELRKMEEEGIIIGYNTLINWNKAESDKVIAYIQVKVCPQKDDGFAKIANKICKYKEIYDVTLVSGEFDLLVTIMGDTIQEVANFVHTKLAPIDGVIGTSTVFMLEKYKEHGREYNKRISNGRMVVTP